MAPCRKLLYFVFVFFFMLAQRPSGCQAGLAYSQSFPGGEQAEVPKHSLPQIQVKKDGTYRSEGNTTDASAEDPGEFAACETCRLGRGKCRRLCREDEKVAGHCKLNYFCCRPRIY